MAERLAKYLMLKHGLFLFDWKFKFSHGKTTFGVCSYKTKTIRLSKHLVLLNDEDKVKDVILHEIAHALTPGAKHGWRWQQKCIEIGAKPERCFGDEVSIPKLKYSLVCKVHGEIAQKGRMIKNDRSCALCCSRYNPKYKLEIVQNY